ncbi:MAG TPA: hypothetical protein VK155_00510 [Bacteroidales bacterium]|jgi:hypothetical protein|nr:hypothetical protein [Bacteroidales bacterium]
MNLKYSVLFLLYISSFSGISGQTGEPFKPHGKPVFLTFENFHYSFNREGNNPAFEITRLYLGYEYFFSKNLSARANLDIADPGVGGLQMTAYVKNAFLQYKKGNLAGRMGMISTDAYNLIEKQWGYRYIFKTLQDEYGFNSSADLGAAIEYTPAKFLSFDASVLNGEGYKRIQSDSVFKYTAGVTFRPVEGLIFRVYSDFMKKEHLQNTISFFAGYTLENFRLGLEYSFQKNNKMIKNHDFSGVSAFVSLKLSEKFSALARYDHLWSSTLVNNVDPWNYNSDGQLLIAGFEYSPVAGVRIAPVYMGWLPANNSKSYTSIAGLQLELRLK